MSQIGMGIRNDVQNPERGLLVSYTPRGIITIRSDADFSKNGFPGAGSISNPYLIQGYSITDSICELIDIQGTNAYFVIKDCLLNNVLKNLDGIYFKNVRHGTIQDCTILNSRHGVFVNRGCHNITILGNNITQSSQSGIRMNNTDYSIIEDNFVYQNTFNGIWLNGSAYVAITNNTVHTNEVGIWLGNSTTKVDVTECTVYGTGHGILVTNSSNSNRIIHNLIYDSSKTNPSWVGVAIMYQSIVNTVQNNTISGTVSYGIDIVGAYANLVKWNNLIGNNLGGASQARDGVGSPYLIYNYWDTWTTPDNNADGIVDRPYALAGGGYDYCPLTHPISPVGYHYLTPVTVLHPNGGESIAEGVTVEWTMVTDSKPHSVTYTLYYSANGGSDWMEMVSGLAVTQYAWNTTILPKGANYLVRVNASCPGGLMNQDTSDAVFSLIVLHVLSEPRVLYPNGAEYVVGIATIQWSFPTDTWNHSVVCKVYYSSNGGLDWTLLTSGLTNSSWNWNTTLLPRGPNYLVMVIANCSGGLSSSDTSDTTFELVEGHALSKPTVLYPNGGEELFEVITIQWTASSDSWPHSVLYCVYYSANGGSDWTELASGLVVTQYSWNTTLLPKGSNYLLRVNASCTGGLMSQDTSNAIFSLLVSHALSEPTVLYPNGAEYVVGIATIQWSIPTDTWNHSVVYELYYSSNGGLDWTLLTSGLTNSSWNWNTDSLPRSSGWLVMVIADCFLGLSSSDTSDATFAIVQVHAVSEPSVLYPNGGEYVFGIVTVQWTASSDTWNHSVVYSVYYSSNVGGDWILLVSGFSTNSYEWNASGVSEGSEYSVRVVASCSESLISEDTSDGLFVFREHTLSLPSVLYPNGGEMINESVTVLWTAAIDSWEHSVLYDLYYSFDGGEHWIAISSGLSTTSYLWNTALLPKGSSYLIKVLSLCTGPIQKEDVSNATFTLQAHSLSVPTLVYPSGGETVKVTVTISWTPCVDSWGHQVTYALAYSPDGGQEWLPLVSGLTANSYEWDTTTVANGERYLVRVEAECTGEISTDDESAMFTIKNTTTTTTTTTTPTTTTSGDNAMLLIASLAIVVVFAVIIVLFLLRQKGFILKP